MKKTFTKILTLIYAVCLLTSCSDDVVLTPGTVEVSVQNMVGTEALQLGNTTYTSPAGDRYSLSSFSYYISNVKLISKFGQFVYVQPESFHLMVQGGKATFVLEEVPVGMYDQIELAIGVDEAHNHSTEQVGDLDSGNGMFWDGDTGYKFMSLVGSFTSDTKSGNLVFHVGGDDNFKVITLDLPKVVDLRDRASYEIEMHADVNELFGEPNLIDFDEMNTASHRTGPSLMADNYSNGFLKVVQVK